MIDWHTLSDELKRDEGFKSRVYQCTAGKLTVGFGHNLEDNDLSESVAEMQLNIDIMEIHEELSNLQWYCELDDFRKRILINMAFNLGMNGLMKFRKMIDALIIKDYETAADEMVDSNWYHQVGQRSVRLVSMMREGQ